MAYDRRGPEMAVCELSSRPKQKVKVALNGTWLITNALGIFLHAGVIYFNH